MAISLHMPWFLCCHVGCFERLFTHYLMRWNTEKVQLTSTPKFYNCLWKQNEIRQASWSKETDQTLNSFWNVPCLPYAQLSVHMDFSGHWKQIFLMRILNHCWMHQPSSVFHTLCFEMSLDLLIEKDKLEFMVKLKFN